MLIVTVWLVAIRARFKTFQRTLAKTERMSVALVRASASTVLNCCGYRWYSDRISLRQRKLEP